MVKECEPYQFWRSAFGLCVLILGPLLLGLLIAIVIKIITDRMQKKTDMVRAKMRGAVRRDQIVNSIVDIKLSSLQQLPDTPKSNAEKSLKSPNKIAPVASNVHRNTSFENLSKAEKLKSEPRDEEHHHSKAEKQVLIEQPKQEAGKIDVL